MIRGSELSLEATLIMGVLNVTPDSFSDGGRYVSADAAIEHGLALVAAGAHIVDVGGESTRPGAESVSVDDEIARISPVVGELARRGVIVSIDTAKPEVAEVAIDLGASIINDVSGFGDERMPELVAASGAGAVVMHMQGLPRTMQQAPVYGDVVGEICAFLEARARDAMRAGVPREAIAIDPGIGFGKTIDHNLEILRRLDEFVAIGYPVMVGTSRKAFLGVLTGREVASDRDLATAVTVAMAVERGAAVVRVHDPASALEAVLVARAIVSGS